MRKQQFWQKPDDDKSANHDIYHFQQPELCPECPELPYSTDTKFWSQNPFVEQQQNKENPYSEHSYGEPVLSSYGAGLGGPDNDLIEIPPDPFSHQPYSRRTDPLHVGTRRDDATQVLFLSAIFRRPL